MQSGGSDPDLMLTKTASVQTAVAGDTILYRVEVWVKNTALTSGVTKAIVTDVLPAGVELVSTKVNRGPGCSGTTTLTCDLDFLSGAIVGVVEVVVRVKTTGTLVNTASVTAPQSDPDLSNNTASVTVRAPSQPLTPPSVVAKPVFGKPVAKPAKALAGTRFTLTLPVRGSNTGAPLKTGRIVCYPSVAGVVLEAPGTFTNGTARLSFVVPKAAKGRLLEIRVRITNGGRSAMKVVTYGVVCQTRPIQLSSGRCAAAASVGSSG